MGNSFSIPMHRATKSGVVCSKNSPTDLTRYPELESKSQSRGTELLDYRERMPCHRLGYPPTKTLSRRGEIPHKDRPSFPTLGIELSRCARSPRSLASPLIGVRLRSRILPWQGSSCSGYSVEIAATTAVGSRSTVRYGNTMLQC